MSAPATAREDVDGGMGLVEVSLGTVPGIRRRMAAGALVRVAGPSLVQVVWKGLAAPET